MSGVSPLRSQTKAVFIVVQLLYTLCTLVLGFAFYYSFWLDVAGLVGFAALSIGKGFGHAKSLSLDMRAS